MMIAVINRQNKKVLT